MSHPCANPVPPEKVYQADCVVCRLYLNKAVRKKGGKKRERMEEEAERKIGGEGWRERGEGREGGGHGGGGGEGRTKEMPSC